MKMFFISKNKGFTLIEITVTVAIFVILSSAIISFLLSINTSGSRMISDREASEGAQTALNEMAYEIRSAQSIYTPTTTSSQLSLQTVNYLPSGQAYTFIDFFLCTLPSGNSAICLKKEGQVPLVITSDYVNVKSLSFSQSTTGTSNSVQIGLNVSAGTQNVSSATLNTTASLRSY